MRYYLIAGEASGDLHGSNLMKQIGEQDQDAVFRFWGGERMAETGGTPVRHYRDLAFMGLTDVLLNLNKIRKYLRQCKEDLLQWKPDALILIDYPGFNLRMAEFAKKAGIQVHYYISPKVWAWNTSRAKIIKQNVDFLYSILPFEKAFYKPYGVEPDYIGNPLCDAIDAYRFDANFLITEKLQRPVIALLPGSRKSELNYVLPKMLEMVELFPEHTFAIAAASHIPDEMYRAFTDNSDVRIIRNKAYDLLRAANAALVCSGTATLETALLNCPQVVCYRFSRLSYLIGRLVIKVKFISLVNLIMNRRVVPELIQNDLNRNNLKVELAKILTGKERDEMLNGYTELREVVGLPGASKRAAVLIVQRCRQNNPTNR